MSIFLAGKKPRHDGYAPPSALYGPDGSELLVNGITRDVLKIGNCSFWHEGGLIRCVDESNGSYTPITPSVFDQNMETLGAIYKEKLAKGEDVAHYLNFLGAKSRDEVKDWYDLGKRLIQAAREHGAPEDKDGPKTHRARLPKFFYMGRQG